MKTIYVTLDENNIVKNWYSEETHGSFKIQDKSTKEEIDSSLFDTEPEKYYYAKSREKNKVIGDEGGKLDYTYYRTKLIDNPDCRIPKDVIKMPIELFKKYQLGQRYKYENNQFVEYIASTNELVIKTKQRLIEKINYLSNRKLKDVKNFIAGREIGIEDEERYKYKYQLAINNADELLKGEATKRGLSVDDFKKIIIKKHSEWLETIYYFSQKIEEFRVVFDDMVNNAETLQDLELIEYKIDILKTLNKKISDEDFDKIINLDKIDNEVEAMTETKKENIFTTIFSKLFNKG